MTHCLGGGVSLLAAHTASQSVSRLYHGIRPSFDDKSWPGTKKPWMAVHLCVCAGLSWLLPLALAWCV